MTREKKIARLAGLVYLGVVLTGIFSLMYVPNKLIDYKDAVATFQNIQASELLFRTGILAGLICYLCFLFLPLVLYSLLNKVNDNMAKIMVLLAVISVPMYFINAQNQLTALSFLQHPVFAETYSLEQLQNQVLFYLNQYNDGMRLVHVFSGLWLFPFGYLVYQSHFLPKGFGILLMMGCFGYLLNFTGRMLISNYSELGISSYLSLPASLGEIGICVWLLVVGVKEKQGKNESEI